MTGFQILATVMSQEMYILWNRYPDRGKPQNWWPQPWVIITRVIFFPFHIWGRGQGKERKEKKERGIFPRLSSVKAVLGHVNQKFFHPRRSLLRLWRRFVRSIIEMYVIRAPCVLCVYMGFGFCPRVCFSLSTVQRRLLSHVRQYSLNLSPVFFFFLLSFLSFIALRTPSPFCVTLRARERKKDLDLLLFFPCCF